MPKTKKESDLQEKSPKLFASGRLDRKKDAYTVKSLALLTELENDIKIYCRGAEVIVLNYLIKEGLKKVKESNIVINVDAQDMGSDID